LELILEACHIEITVDDEGQDKTRSTTGEGKKEKVREEAGEKVDRIPAAQVQEEEAGETRKAKTMQLLEDVVDQALDREEEEEENSKRRDSTRNKSTEGGREHKERGKEKEERERERERECVCWRGLGVNSQIGTPTKLFVSCAITHPPIYNFLKF